MSLVCPECGERFVHEGGRQCPRCGKLLTEYLNYEGETHERCQYCGYDAFVRYGNAKPAELVVCPKCSHLGKRDEFDAGNRANYEELGYNYGLVRAVKVLCIAATIVFLIWFTLGHSQIETADPPIGYESIMPVIGIEVIWSIVLIPSIIVISASFRKTSFATSAIMCILGAVVLFLVEPLLAIPPLMCLISVSVIGLSRKKELPQTRTNMIRRSEPSIMLVEKRPPSSLEKRTDGTIFFDNK